MSKSNNQTIHIACAIDDGFSYPLSAMLVSCLENNKMNNIKIHLFSASLSEHYVNLFSSLVNDYNQQFSFYHLKSDVLKDLPVSNRISIASYYRLLIPENIDYSVEKYLYLDADLIVTGDLKPFYNTNLKNEKVFAAINDISAIEGKLFIKHKIPKEYLYFNAGVLLIDKKKWLNMNAGTKVLKYLQEYPELCQFHDQDGLNATLYKERQPASPIWNQQVGIYFSDPEVINRIYPEEANKARNNPVIVHFNGIEKPWNHASAHPYKKDFKKYAKKANGFFYYEKLTLKKFIKRHVLYRVFGWERVSKYYYNKAKKQFS